MEQQFRTGISLYEELYYKHFLIIIEQKVSDIGNLINDVTGIHTKYLAGLEKVNEENDIHILLEKHNNYLKDIWEYNKLSYPLTPEFNSQKELKQLLNEHRNLVAGLPKNITLFETNENRLINDDDTYLIKFIKRIKQFRFWAYSLFINNNNISIKRRAPLRTYLIQKLFFDIMPALWSSYKQLFLLEIELLEYYQSAFNQIDDEFKIQDQCNIPLVKQTITQVLDKSSDAQTILNQTTASFKELIKNELINKTNEIASQSYKLGTAEHRSIKNRKWHTKRSIRKLSLQTIRQINSWEISLFSISEAWCFNADLFILRIKALISLHSERFNKSIAKISATCGALSRRLDTTAAEYDKVYAYIDKSSFDQDTISSHKTNISKILSSDGLFLSKVNHSQTILYALNEIEQEVVSEIESINDKRMIYQGNLEPDKMQLTKLNPVHLKDLLKLEIQPRFSSDIELLKQNILQKIAFYESEITNLVHISEYNFETISSILTNKDSNIDDLLNIIKEGKSKVINKLKEITADLSELETYTRSQLTGTIKNLVDELTALTEKERIGELNLRLLKAKAITKSTRFKNLIIGYLSGILKRADALRLLIQNKGFKFSKHLAKIYSQEEVQASINNEISTFLSEIAITKDKLPFLYQRLFKLEPVDEGYLYFKRSAEINHLKLAYNNWKKGRFANIAITAEKGAGVTSIINYVVNDSELEYTRINFQEYNNIYRQDEFIFTLSEILDLTPLNELELFIDELNNTKGIIILEGLQYAYLKKVDGFETLKLLFEIISKTNKNIFWICTCTLHAWNYLNKAISIEEYFGHIIKLGEFSNEEMIDIVKKRHQVSGYELVYLKSKADTNNKKLAKMSIEDTQHLLEKQYFQILNTLAKGNISIALIFWLRSIKRIENNTLYINSMDDFNISFIRGLKQEKLFCLYAILLHDGLDLEGFCKVMRLSPEQGRMKLFQMVDDGLLLELNKRYVINLLLYRPTIDALKAKNILH